MQCDLKCPPSVWGYDCKNKYNCCSRCCVSRKEFFENGGYDYYHPGIKKTIKALWSDESGFATATGCVLPREVRPKECVLYDCKEYDFFVSYKWDGVSWVRNGSVEIRPSKITEEWLERYNNLLAELKE